MIALVLALVMSQPPSPDEAIALCKPALARKAGGEVATMDVAKTHTLRGRRTIEGRLTVFAQMGPAPAGSARTHHLGRIEFSYGCEVSNGRVRKARLNPFKP
jgi:hypothetical protein